MDFRPLIRNVGIMPAHVFQSKETVS